AGFDGSRGERNRADLASLTDGAALRHLDKERAHGPTRYRWIPAVREVEPGRVRQRVIEGGREAVGGGGDEPGRGHDDAAARPGLRVPREAGLRDVELARHVEIVSPRDQTRLDDRPARRAEGTGREQHGPHAFELARDRR